MSYYNNYVSIDIDPEDVLNQMSTEEILDNLDINDIINYINDKNHSSGIDNTVSCLNILAKFIRNNSGFYNICTPDNMIKYVTELINDNFYLINK